MGLQKLTLVAYSDEQYTSKASGTNSYSVQINPESYSHTHSTSYSPGTTTDTAGTTTKYHHINP